MAVGLMIQPLLIRWLRHRDMMDVPNHRSSHTSLTPRGGGLGVILALAVGTLVSGGTAPPTVVILLGCLALGAVGLADDLDGLAARVRLLSQLLVGGLAGFLLPAPTGIFAAIGICAIWVASFVNAFNFMDGINGISAVTGLVAGCAYAVMGYQYLNTTSLIVGAALAGACLSFLPFNAPRALVFLGDVGSYALGFLIAALAWITWAAGAPLLLAVSPTLVYLVDTGTTLLRRWKRREPLTEAHREHTYQLLVQRGWSHLQTTAFVGLVQVAVLVIAAVGLGRYPALATALMVAVLGVYVAAPTMWAGTGLARRGAE